MSRVAVLGFLIMVGLLALVFAILAVGVSHGIRTMGYAKPSRLWFWRRRA